VEDLRAAFAQHVSAFNAQDLDALLAGLTPDARWVTGASTATGRTELAELFGGAFEVAPTLRLVTLVADGDRVAAELIERLVHDGVAHEFAIAGFYRFEDGQIAAAKIYREGSAELGIDESENRLPGP
jgi:uncharacterized protein